MVTILQIIFTYTFSWNEIKIIIIISKIIIIQIPPGFDLKVPTNSEFSIGFSKGLVPNTGDSPLLKPTIILFSDGYIHD